MCTTSARVIRSLWAAQHAWWVLLDLRLMPVRLLAADCTASGQFEGLTEECISPASALQAARLRSFGSDALVLFSGDAFHPSLLSTVTQARVLLVLLAASAAPTGGLGCTYWWLGMQPAPLPAAANDASLTAHTVDVQTRQQPHSVATAAALRFRCVLFCRASRWLRCSMPAT